MEHNIDKLLQDKIFAEERKPIPWRKEATWERIEAKAADRTIPFSYYYVAAACVVVIALTLLGMDWNPSGAVDNTTTGIVMPRKQKAIEAIPNKATPANNIVNSTAVAKVRKITEKEKSLNELPPSIPSDSSRVDPTATATEITVTKAAQDENLDPESRQKVRPIIGIVIEHASEPMMISKKKNKIKFFPQEKDAPLLEQPEPTTLTARIN